MTKNELLDEIMNHVDFFVDQQNRDVYYAQFENVYGKLEFTKINAEPFKSFIYVKSREISEDKLSLDPERAVKQIQYMLNHTKNFKSCTVNVRTAGDLRVGIEYDLQNASQKSVQVTANGWQVGAKVQKFTKAKISLPQKTPKPTDKSPLDLLKPFVNVKGDTYILFVVWLIQAFSRGTHHALLVLADKGSGKSTLCKIIKKILDPCKFTVTTIPEKKDDLVVLLFNSFLCCFDNVSKISDDVSDIFCGAITGTSVVKRALYTDSELSIATLHNTIVLNGIDAVPGKDDLIERTLLLRLTKLQSYELKQDSDIWKKLDKELPYILGAIFNTLSTAMSEITKITFLKLPRMADAFVEMVAIAKALGISEEDFKAIYNANVNELQLVSSTPPVVAAVKEYVAKQSNRKVSDKSTKLFEKIRESYSGNKELLPNSASHFNQKLDKYHYMLLENNIRVNIDDTGVDGTVLTLLKKKK